MNTCTERSSPFDVARDTVFHPVPSPVTRHESPAASATVAPPSMVSERLGLMVMVPLPLLRTAKLKPAPSVAAASISSVQVPLQSTSLPRSAATTL